MPVALSSFTENDVDISIQLNGDAQGGYFLAATFTPPEGYHLYGKDIPIAGVDGLGRPTLLELPADSALKATGAILESASALEPEFEPKELLAYPLGEVTLSLPVELPVGNEWVEDSVLVTYMACNENGCKPPVIRKEISIHIPGAGLVGQD
ncbi:MAG: hypothetical protein IT314_13280 [Anaerolineales bacterium]|nr:hypothetical protein [Anaerolineales bacterium]